MSQTPLRAATTLAFSELERALTTKSTKTPSAAQLAELPAKSALFVTWTKRGQLRGCIGTFAQLALANGIKKYALIAALEDTRFRPISASELPSLAVAVTLLGELVKCADKYDWELGKHGVEAVFADGASATFLPDVPVEQGWTKKDTLEALAAKAGTESQSLTLYRYEGTKEEMSYAEYIAQE